MQETVLIINKEYSKRGISSENVSIGHSYERVMPGPNYIDSIQNFFRVYAGVDDKSATTKIHSHPIQIIRSVFSLREAVKTAKRLKPRFRPDGVNTLFQFPIKYHPMQYARQLGITKGLCTRS